MKTNCKECGCDLKRHEGIDFGEFVMCDMCAMADLFENHPPEGEGDPPEST